MIKAALVIAPARVTVTRDLHVTPDTSVHKILIGVAGKRSGVQPAAAYDISSRSPPNPTFPSALHLHTFSTWPKRWMSMQSRTRRRKRRMDPRQISQRSAVCPISISIPLIISHADPFSTVILNHFALINQAVASFDPRFTLRALRSISTIRKADNFPQALAIAIRTAFPRPQHSARKVLEEMLPVDAASQQNGTAEGHGQDSKLEVAEVAEVWAYLGLLVQVSPARRRLRYEEAMLIHIGLSL